MMSQLSTKDSTSRNVDIRLPLSFSCHTGSFDPFSRKNQNDLERSWFTSIVEKGIAAKTLGSPRTFWQAGSTAGSRDRDVQGCPWIAFSRVARSLSSHEESCVVTVEPLSHQQVGLLGTQRGWPPTPPLPSSPAQSPARTSEKPASTTTTTTTTDTVHRESVSLVTGLLVVFSTSLVDGPAKPPPRPRAAAAPLLRTIINGRRAFASPRQLERKRSRGPK
ncbi:hypothetical protein K0M31_017362 [Melipona bicolor]|uniref:Uncharacterized protein n=1 Tax=Melipona bicolor TaxID=60889 RepID=A0AA40G4T0_9HYME|nr:hypothetical protein K0M31_017362 [Melipona bicolor]